MNPKLLSRYVEAVKTFLPRGQRDDIAQELTEDILSRAEALEAELGRGITDAEQEAILKQLGHPALVAGRFRTDHRSVAFGRQLIGPELYPLFIRVLSISLPLTILGGFIGRLVFDELRADALPGMVGMALANVAIVTAIFAFVQARLTRHPDHWDPRDPLSPPAAVNDALAVSRFTVIVELVVGAVVLLWLISLSPAMNALPGQLLAPVWGWIYLPGVLLTIASLAPPAINLFRPRWMRFRLASRMLLELGWLAILALLFVAGEWVRLPEPAISAAVNQFILWCIVVTAGISALQLLADGYRLLRLRGSQTHAAGKGALAA